MSGMPLFDATYSRHGGNAESIAANEKANLSKYEVAKQIYILAVVAGQFGITSAEVERQLGKAKNTFSGRFKDLEIGVRHGNQIVKLVKATWLERREGCRPYVADIYSNGIALSESVQ